MVLIQVVLAVLRFMFIENRCVYLKMLRLASDYPPTATAHEERASLNLQYLKVSYNQANHSEIRPLMHPYICWRQRQKANVSRTASGKSAPDTTSWDIRLTDRIWRLGAQYPIENIESYRTQPIDDPKRPYATFKFKYRSRSQPTL